MLRHAHKPKTTESQQRRRDLYQRTDQYKQVAMCAPSSSCCSAWPKPQQWTLSLFGVHNLHEIPGLLLDFSCLLNIGQLTPKRINDIFALTSVEHLLKSIRLVSFIKVLSQPDP